jgi:hypothetical protein
VGATWVAIRWLRPILHSNGISRYDVHYAMMDGFARIQSTSNNIETNLNVTNLQPNAEYTFRVRGVAVFRGVDILGEFRGPETATTLIHRGTFAGEGNDITTICTSGPAVLGNLLLTTLCTKI